MLYSQQPYYYYPFYQPQVVCPVFYFPAQTLNQQEHQVEPIMTSIIDNQPTNSQQLNYDTEELDVEKSEKSKDTKKQSKKERETVIKKKKELPNTKIHEVLDSTNLHKNFAKALIAYTLRSQFIIYKLLGEKKGQEFLDLMQSVKNKLCNLTHILQFTKNDEFLRAFRTLGFIFLKKESVPYIYNSKIQQKTSHLKHKVIIKKTLLKI
ncbi:unnamed protein product (macronuclear) [Paramecium tetraurelia]|uniref:Uncharacterized protein n=1 Tax=Paramecium tetraurelia TaxID=5888 RepID=A0D9W4_PARTE|nr:uncharacterized protein GSPATT00014763001 [Paramecium tetraurelia]CAK79831.1 unnamed protein product [Paramecium tetraurelia]|eukprot:XP_001447228.1 hypothetical protein (macronuclear) [Paramecium tetraurelia strain d4-2]